MLLNNTFFCKTYPIELEFLNKIIRTLLLLFYNLFIYKKILKTLYKFLCNT